MFAHGEAHPKALVTGLTTLENSDLRPMLSLVRAPTLVIAGQYDRVTLPAASRALSEALPDARYVEIRRAGTRTLSLAHSGIRRARDEIPTWRFHYAPVMTPDDSTTLPPRPAPRYAPPSTAQSASYEAAAVLQARVADELLSRLDPSSSPPEWSSTWAPAPAA